MKTTQPIVIIGVNYKSFDEISLLISKLENKESGTIESIPYYKGTLNQKDVVVVQTDIRQKAAYLTTQLIVKHLNPRLIISEGSAGSHRNDLHIGDIVLVNELINLDTCGGDTNNPSTWKLTDPILCSDKNLINIIKSNTNIDTVRCATYSVWNKEFDFINKIHNQFNTDIEEMESYSICKVCSENKIPFVGIRIISDNELIHEEYNPIVNSKIQEFVMNVIKLL